jgi:hypothetical protein
VTGDQWFHLWMTLIQTVGGGLVTLGGVALGFLFARLGDQRKRWQEEVTFWIDELSAINRTLFTTFGSNPQTWPTELDDETELSLFTVLANLMNLIQSRSPAPRDSVTDVVISSIITGYFAGNVDMSAAAHMSTEERTKALAEFRGGFRAVHTVLSDTVELLATWQHRGVSKQAIKRALLTRSGQLGDGSAYFVRRPEERNSGPSSFLGGWRGQQ